jgi:tetratricopeptide (TPR) repeat protein
MSLSRAGFSVSRWTLTPDMRVYANHLLFVLALALGACDVAPVLDPLPDPDLSAFEPAVRSALGAARAELERIAEAHPTKARLADAHGGLAMTYHAQDLVVPAAVAYADARLLAPREKRWPYLQGHLFNDAARVTEAIKAFEAALELDGRDPATLQALGRAYLQVGNVERARVMFQRLGENEKARAAAAAGLGKVALMAHDYPHAIAQFEEALRLEPGASHLRQPLANAYQAVGDSAKAALNVRLYSVDGDELSVGDPAADALADKVVSSKVLMRRGQRAANAGRFELAEKAFRAAAAADPRSAEAAADHGISLANLDRLDEAKQRLTEALRMDDSIAIAHLGLAVLLDREGEDRQAIEQYEATLRNDAGNVRALVYLADALMRQGRPLEAASRYREARGQDKLDPVLILNSLALAYAKAGRFAEARKALEEGLAVKPDNPFLGNALARVLACAPNPTARDVARALDLAKSVFERTRSPDVGQTYAMALAASGRFAEAVTLQQETIIAFERSGAPVSKQFLVGNLARYRRHLRASNGWAADDPLFAPRSPAAARRAS